MNKISAMIVAMSLVALNAFAVDTTVADLVTGTDTSGLNNAAGVVLLVALGIAILFAGFKLIKRAVSRV